MRTTWRRWAYLVLGGALVVPFGVLGSLVGAAVPDVAAPNVVGAVVVVVVILVATPLAGMLPGVRLLEETATRELVGGPLTEQPAVDRSGPAPWTVRWRAAAWFTAHVVLGGTMSAASLGLPAAAVVFTSEGAQGLPAAARAAAVVGAGLAAVALLYPLTALVGSGLARWAPNWLGPSAAERLAALQHRADRLAERNRLARELHDSVGHALSIVTVQAGAAERVLDSDPAFARRALGAITESAREALADLDHVLGLLREDERTTPAGRSPAPTLEALDDLLRRTRSAGVDLHARITGNLDLPRPVSAEAYRIVQESVTNAVRHAGDVPVRLRVEAHRDTLDIEVVNPMSESPGPPPVTGSPGTESPGTESPRTESPRTASPGTDAGRGLRGMAERVAVLRGTVDAGPRDGHWHVRVHLPVRRAS